jgi:succinyl-CoA synthetase beta subunit
MGTTTMAEADSKDLLASYGLEVAAERVVPTADAAADAALELGLPVVVKLNGDRIAHKTERGLVRLNLRRAEQVRDAAAELLARATPDDGPVSILVARFLEGHRELIAGVVRDPQLGHAVMLGVGGIAAEALGDVSFRLVPLRRADAEDLIGDLKAQALLGPFRGEPAVDRDRLVDVLMALSACAADRPGIASVDVNPLKVCDGVPIAVDALVEVDT